MPGHRAGVAEAQIHVLFSIGASKVRAFRFRDKNRKFARPLFHPIHRNAAKQRLLRALVQLRRTRMFRHEALCFAFLQLLQLLSIDVRHVSKYLSFGRGSPQFVNDFLRSIRPRSACQSIPRMRSVAAEKKPFHRSLIPRPIEQRPHGEELVQRKFAVENVAARETVRSFPDLAA